MSKLHELIFLISGELETEDTVFINKFLIYIQIYLWKISDISIVSFFLE